MIIALIFVKFIHFEFFLSLNRVIENPFLNIINI